MISETHCISDWVTDRGNAKPYLYLYDPSGTMIRSYVGNHYASQSGYGYFYIYMDNLNSYFFVYIYNEKDDVLSSITDPTANVGITNEIKLTMSAHGNPDWHDDDEIWKFQNYREDVFSTDDYDHYSSYTATRVYCQWYAWYTEYTIMHSPYEGETASCYWYGTKSVFEYSDLTKRHLRDLFFYIDL